MSKVYLVVTSDPTKEERLVAVCLTPDEVEGIARSYMKPEVKFLNGNFVFMPSALDIKVKEIESGTILEHKEVELPLKVVTVPSFTKPGLDYGVSVDAVGNPVACTCKAFEFHGQTMCKHMREVVRLNVMNTAPSSLNFPGVFSYQRGYRR